ncbi:MAG: hypothetical protein FWB86_13875 [Treponema sp.]|nr:hypothetical protein [Treponema sp.]
MKKILLGVCLIIAFAFTGCASNKLTYVFDPEIPPELMSVIVVPNYVLVTSFDGKEVAWTSPPISLTSSKVGVPSGEHTFLIDTIDTNIDGTKDDRIPTIRGKSYTKNFEAGKGYQLILRGGEIQLIDL